MRGGGEGHLLFQKNFLKSIYSLFLLHKPVLDQTHYWYSLWCHFYHAFPAWDIFCPFHRLCNSWSLHQSKSHSMLARPASFLHIHVLYSVETPYDELGEMRRDFGCLQWCHAFSRSLVGLCVRHGCIRFWFQYFHCIKFMTSCYREITRLGERFLFFDMFLEILYLESGSLGRASYMFEKLQWNTYNLVWFNKTWLGTHFVMSTLGKIKEVFLW